MKILCDITGMTSCMFGLEPVINYGYIQENDQRAHYLVAELVRAVDLTL
jgi:hypothetical protein